MTAQYTKVDKHRVHSLYEKIQKHLNNEERRHAHKTIRLVLLELEEEERQYNLDSLN